MSKILLAEDDEVVAESVADALQLEKFVVEVVECGQEAAQRLRLYDYDLAILDWGLPNMLGIDILKQYRKAGGTIPILILTGKGDVEFRIEGLESGADDYLAKPFAMRELLARVRSLLRRPQSPVPDDLKVGSLTLHMRSQTVSRDGENIVLLAKEVQLLMFLARHRGQWFTAQDLLNKVWHSESDSTDDAVRQCLVRLRKKIDRSGEESIIKTVRNLGYCIEQGD